MIEYDERGKKIKPLTDVEKAAIERLRAEGLRKEAMIAKFDGAIKYGPMLNDHPDWTNEQCIAFARKWHAVVIERLRAGEPGWNEGIPYCRNDVTDAMAREASK